MKRVAALVLAAGASSRFRARDASVPTKLVATLDGVALVAHVAAAALASRARPIIVVTGHARQDVEAALQRHDLAFIHNADYATGLSGSLRTGLRHVPAYASGALVLLGDMPRVGADLIDRLIEVFARTPDIEAVVPVRGGRRGNPVLLGRPLFDAAMRLTGDEGARRLLTKAKVLDVEVSDEAVSLDIDDPEALRSLHRR